MIRKAKLGWCPGEDSNLLRKALAELPVFRIAKRVTRISTQEFVGCEEIVCTVCIGFPSIHPTGRCNCAVLDGRLASIRAPAELELERKLLIFVPDGLRFGSLPAKLSRRAKGRRELQHRGHEGNVSRLGQMDCAESSTSPVRRL